MLKAALTNKDLEGNVLNLSKMLPLREALRLMLKQGNISIKLSKVRILAITRVESMATDSLALASVQQQQS